MLRKLLRFTLPFSVLIAAAMLHLSEPALLELLRYKVFDYYQQIQPRDYEPMPVTIVDIDEASLEKLGQWPWSRATVARLTDKLAEAEAAAIGFDIVFAETDRTSPNTMLPLWEPYLDVSALKLDNSSLPDFDALFAESLSNAPSVMGYVLDTNSEDMPDHPYGMVIKGEDALMHLVPYSGAIRSLPVLTDAAYGNGALNAIPDQDGLIRKVPLIYHIDEQIVTGLAAEMLRVAQGASTYIVSSLPTGIEQVRIGALNIPTDAQGHVWIHYTPYTPERYISAWEVLDNSFDNERIAGHFVLIGTSAAGLKDIRSTPLSPVTNGVEIHAQLLEQVLQEHYLSRPDWINTAELLSMLSAGLLVWGVIAITSPFYGAICTLLLLTAAGVFSWYGYTEHRLLIDPVSPGLAIMLLYLMETVRGYITAEAERQQVRHAFSHYMSPALVEKLAKSPESLKLGGEMKPMTILFCDIRGFTTISEQFDAEGLTRFINAFLTPMTDIILAKEGTIDKYMGDCIMAFWNAPLDDADHARHGCLAALEMIARLAEFNKVRQQQCDSEGSHFIPVNIGIGLNTDICCVGNMGSDQRFDYSVLGDGVNLASRLEGQSKHYGMTIVIGENTQAAVTYLATIELDLIMVKGKTTPTRIYGLLGDESLAASDTWQVLAKTNTAMLAAYRAQQWDNAKAALENLHIMAEKLGLVMDGYISLYAERIHDFILHPPPADWDGVYRAISK